MIDKEKTYWQFIRDLKMLGDDVKSLVLYGGCRWGEPSPIPAIVERLSKLDWGDVASSLMYMKSIGMTRDDFKNDVKDIYNYHLECSQDLAYSDIDRVALYARRLNRFILICGEKGMGGIIPLSKQDETDTGDNVMMSGGIDAKDIPNKIISLFKPTFKDNGILDKSSKNLAKEYLDKVRGCSLSVCANVYNEEYGAKGKAITGNEWGKKKKVLYNFLVDHIGVAKDIKERTFDNNLE